MDSYFNQLMEIQNSTDHSFFLLDQDSEPRFVIEADKRTIIIPAEFQFLGVKTDQRSEKIYFEVDRIFDDVDLSTKTCVIQYINAGTDDVDEGIYPVTELDTTTVPGKIVFKWEVDNIVCKYAGVVAFSVRFYEIDPETKLYTYCWNTIPESLPVLDGLNVSGSVTEDFPTELLEWNARMAALNTEITNKISAADATMKADLKTAKGYMDGAQAARGGAEEAESRVKKIVAGNEAYTKVESDTMYAKSQVKESERGTSVEISPEDGSNLAVTTYGFTEQAGTGDPSPINVRQLTNGGLKLVAKVFDGNSDENWRASASDNNVQYISLPLDYSVSADTTVLAYCDRLEKVVPSSAGDNPAEIGTFSAFARQRGDFIFKINIGVNSTAAAKQALAANPITIWYVPANESQATGLYAPIILSSGEYRATCLPLTAPLCEGDSVVSWAKSGCDKTLVLDGSQDIQWIENSAIPYGGSFVLSVPDAVIWTSTEIAPVYSDKLNRVPNDVSKFNQGVISLRSASKGFIFTLFGAKTTEAGKQYLAEHPITIWYRSTNYTEADDITVSLETHVRAVLVLDGTTTVTKDPSGYISVAFPSNVPAPKGTSKSTNLCSIAKFEYSATANGFYVLTPANLVIFGSAYVQAAGWTSGQDCKTYLTENPATLVYELATPITYAHPAVDIVSSINENDSIIVSGQKYISVSYHKSLDKTIVELDNKSYSKQESDNIFAKALRGTAEAAKSITIHPDAGSNVVVTAHGFTKQEGSEDASPDNQRPIMSGGMQANLFPGFTQLAYRDTSTGEVVPNNNGNVTSDVFPCKRNQDYYVSVKRSVNSSLSVWFWDSDGALLQKLTVSDGQVDPSGSFKSPVNAVKMAISAYSAGGTLENYTNQLLAYGKDAVPYTKYTGNEYAVALEWHGENILPKNKSSASTQTGVTFTPNDDGTIAVKGTATEDADYYTFGSYSSYDVKFILSPGEYYLSGNKEASGVVLYLLSRTKSGVKNIASANTTAGTKFTVDVYTPVTAFLVRAVKGQTVNGIVKPMLNVGATASPYKQGSEILRAPIVLAAPLCQGDKLITKVKSGCDVEVVLTGTEDWILNPNSGTAASGSRRFQLGMSVTSSNTSANAVAVAYCSQFAGAKPKNTYGTNFDNTFSVQNADLQLRVAGISTVDALKQFLAARYAAGNPVIVWYRSANYTEADDIAVSLETHVRWKYTFTGKEGWTVGGVGAYLSSINLPGNKTAISGKCSHFKYQYSYTENAIMVETSGRVALGTAAISKLGFSGVEDWKAYLAEQYAAGNPVEVEYELSAPITYTHEPVDFIASPDEDGALVITGEADGTVSAEYNKDITYAFNELQSAVLTAIAKLSL